MTRLIAWISNRWQLLTKRTRSDSTSSTVSLHEDGQHRGGGSYTELMGGSVPCPSCRGSGRIPKEMERQLIALIPVDDDRLKPKRTWLWVLLGVVICLLLAGGGIFMLVPRAVDLSSQRMAIDYVNVTAFNRSEKLLTFQFMNAVNVSNSNYYSVRIVNASATVMSIWYPLPTEDVGRGWNLTGMSVRSLTNDQQLMFNNTVTVPKSLFGFCAGKYSEFSLYLSLQFDVTITVEYLNHREQNTISAVQQVCCIPSGNCTIPFDDVFG